MKSFIIAVSVVVLVFAVAGQAQTSAPKPGPEQKKAEAFVGNWTYEGEYKPGPLGPGGKATGEYTAQMILGGFFVQGHWVEKGPSGEVQGLETFGYDPVTKNYAQSQFQNDGSLGSGTLTVSGNIWNYAGTWVLGGKQYKVRGTVTFTVDLTSLMMKIDISPDGKSWTPCFEAKYTKAKPLP